MNSRDEAKILGAFLIGGLLGAGLALLFAPQAGRKTRKDISKFARRAGSDIKEKTDDIVESIEELVENIENRISHAASMGKELGEDTRKGILRAVENGQRIIEKQKAKLTKLIK